jgi:RimJ/RimL family protein N-acetyltransferase
MDPHSYSRAFALKNGVRILLRAIQPDDRERLRTAFHRLEPRTIYKRFFGTKRDLSERELTAATSIDFDAVVALVAVLDSNPETIIGGGRYARFPGRDAPDAEVAFTVEEDYQGLGLASLILHELCAIARGAGIRHFIAEVLPTNTAMLQVFRRSGLPMTTRIEPGVVHVTLEL